MVRERVLIIDEHSDHVSVLAASLTDAGYDVLVVSPTDEDEVQRSLYYCRPHYLVVDDEFLANPHHAE